MRPVDVSGAGGGRREGQARRGLLVQSPGDKVRLLHARLLFVLPDGIVAGAEEEVLLREAPLPGP